MSRRALLGLGWLLTMTACGSGDDGGGGGDSPDAPPGAIDAAAGPDAPARVMVTGVTQTVQGTSTVSLGGATVDALARTGGASLASATSGQNGAYTLTLDTGGAAVDAYFRARSNGRLDTYLYPPRPVSADTPNVTLVLLSETTLGQLAGVGGATYDRSKGFVALIVSNAAGTPVAGATVTISPAGSARIMYAVNGLPDRNATATDASGTVFIANTATGQVTVDGSMGGTDFQAVTFEARAGAMTNTLLLP